MYVAHQHTTFCTTTPLQEAVAIAFEDCTHQTENSNYFGELKAEFQRKRDRLVSLLQSAGLEPIVPQGSYFVLADTNKINPSVYMNSSDKSSRDYQFCRWLVREIGVAAIPPTAFYHSEKSKKIAEGLARFCFCKKDETIEEAGERLQKLRHFFK
jgi:aspartate/methionine/tyrosine aminotransferase